MAMPDDVAAATAALAAKVAACSRLSLDEYRYYFRFSSKLICESKISTNVSTNRVWTIISVFP